MSSCNFPGCANYVWTGSTSGMCPSHIHKAGFCACKRCADLPAPRAARPGIRQVELPRFDTHSGHDQGRIIVSLPAEPWEVRA